MDCKISGGAAPHVVFVHFVALGVVGAVPIWKPCTVLRLGPASLAQKLLALHQCWVRFGHECEAFVYELRSVLVGVML